MQYFSTKLRIDQYYDFCHTTHVRTPPPHTHTAPTWRNPITLRFGVAGVRGQLYFTRTNWQGFVRLIRCTVQQKGRGLCTCYDSGGWAQPTRAKDSLNSGRARKIKPYRTVAFSKILTPYRCPKDQSSTVSPVSIGFRLDFDARSVIRLRRQASRQYPPPPPCPNPSGV